MLTAKKAAVQIINNNINKSKIWIINLDNGYREEKYFFYFQLVILTIKKKVDLSPPMFHESFI